MPGTWTAAEAGNTLVLVRHGQSQANADGLFTGLLDVPLTDRGRSEAARAARMLNDVGLAPPAWFCSPLRRARETAAILTAELRRPPRNTVWDWRLAERNYGALTGRTYGLISEYRTDAKAGWDIVIDPEVNMSLKLGVNHRHNSEPGEGKKENDLEYFAMIGWSF